MFVIKNDKKDNNKISYLLNISPYGDLRFFHYTVIFTLILLFYTMFNNLQNSSLKLKTFF